jgi:hypothetical protein
MLDAILVHSKLIQLEGLARAAGYEEVSVSTLHGLASWGSAQVRESLVCAWIAQWLRDGDLEKSDHRLKETALAGQR